MLPALDGHGPRYRQLYRGLREGILDGRLASSERLPATRGLARTLGVSRNTVLQAYEQLIAEGYLVSRPGAGTFVAGGLVPASEGAPHRAPPAAAPRLSDYARAARRIVPPHYLQARDPVGPAVDFQYGIPLVDETSMRLWRRCLARRVRGLPPDYPPVRGLPRLRAAVAEHLRRRRGMRVDPDCIVIVNGSQQALDLVARMLLGADTAVAIEEPHYPGARHIFAATGTRLIPCPVDGEGFDTACLDTLPETVRLVYVTPSHQFPTGGVLPLRRRLDLLQWAARANVFIVEDDYDSDYVYESQPLESMQALDASGRVIYVGTFAKVLAPALRLGFLVVPEALLESVVAAKWLSDRGTAPLEQAVLADFVEAGHFDRHLRRMARRLESRQRTLVQSLQREFGDDARVSGARAGMHLTLWLPRLPRERTGALTGAAAVRGIRVYPIAPYYLGAPPCAGLLLGYATLTEDAIRTAVRGLAAAYRDCR